MNRESSFSLKKFAHITNSLYEDLKNGASYKQLYKKAIILENMIGDLGGTITFFVPLEWYDNLVKDFTAYVFSSSRNHFTTTDIFFLQRYHKKFLYWFSKEFLHSINDEKEYLNQIISLYERAYKKSTSVEEKDWWKVKVRVFKNRLTKLENNI